MGEKEYGTYGPAVAAETFFTNPVYYEDGIGNMATREYSRYVNELLDGLGYSYEMIKYRQQMWAENDKLQNRHENLDCTEVTTGGKGEGTALYFESDVDIMYIAKDVICADNPQHFIHQENITLFQTETHITSPGYTRLKLLRFNGRLSREKISSSLFKNETGSNYLSSQFFTEAVKVAERQVLERLGMTPEPTSGPSTPSSNKYSNYDHVFSFRCICPNILDRWISRPRFKGWPSPETIHEISLLDGHAVPVGLKGSPNMYREWRICYSLAELHLMRILNETQLKVYIILKKICKSVLNSICKDMTSYIMKNIIFWVCEMNGTGLFTQEMIMARLFDCIKYLRRSVSENNLPSYMIPARNLLAGRIDAQEKQRLIITLGDLLNERGKMFLRCGKLRDAMIVMYKTPNMFRVFSEKRDKVESLWLVMRMIGEERMRPGMSSEELKQLLWQNELYCDMQTQIKQLIQFDPQELQQMGKTHEEINDLWLTKLNQLLS